MVLTPRSYTFQPLDYDVLFSNAVNLRKSFGAPKTSKGKEKSKGRKTVPIIEESPDIVEARRIARFLLDYIHNVHPSTNDNLVKVSTIHWKPSNGLILFSGNRDSRVVNPERKSWLGLVFR